MSGFWWYNSTLSYNLKFKIMTRVKKVKYKNFPNVNKRVQEDLLYHLDWLEWKLENCPTKSIPLWESKIKSWKYRFSL